MAVICVMRFRQALLLEEGDILRAKSASSPFASETLLVEIWKGEITEVHFVQMRTNVHRLSFECYNCAMGSVSNLVTF